MILKWFRRVFWPPRFDRDQIGCRVLGHRWINDTPNWMRRYCNRCGKASYLMEKKHPKIGQAKFTWSVE